MPAKTDLPILTLRELNRALLARQLLLRRAKVDVVEAIEDLACLQAQWAPSPYVALWTRLSGFERVQLDRPIDHGEVVKTTIMRATLHLVSAREYPAYHRATLEGRFGAWRPLGAPNLADLEKIHRRVLRYASAAPRSRKDIETFLAKDTPKNERMRNWLLFTAITSANGLIWEPTGAHFEHRKLARFMAPPARLQRDVDDESAYDLVVHRHLGAFGPASVQDIATWGKIRVRNIRAALARNTHIRRFRDERGRELFDLAPAPRPSADIPAPPRFLARFDAAILGHHAAERTRILPDPYKKQVIFSAEVWTTFLIDGFVAGRWKIAVSPKQAVIELLPFKPLSKAHKTALIEEGEHLARFYAPESKTHGVRA